ncbi:MAG TPA: 4-hydroxythreonine-4-phosphate dehydrogenase PdxA [Rhizomicrobium sp.]|nr:4-hydroxythreonine-4-phosphate dehydrogenase PdxA [Rhizomicrobium sp.]
MSRRAEDRQRSPILITMGEPAGIGPEVTAKAWHALGGCIRGRALMLVGDTAVFRAQSDFADDAFWRGAGRTAMCVKKGPEAVIGAIETAVYAAYSGQAAAIVTSPINKATLLEAGFPFAGHTEFLADLTRAPRAVMMLAGGGLRVVPLTVHIALAEVPAKISQRAIIETAEIVLASLARDFAIVQPRLAVAGLNPHAGESGKLGIEEEEIIAPAVETLRGRGHVVLGPLSADTMFHETARAQYDAALCMYHDQALIPIKTLAFWEGVNVTLGLPIVRTSPDHGTAFDIAGQGKADPRSMIAAIRLAADIADARNL